MKSKKQMKKMTAFSCIMMALIMVLSMLPITRAFADEETTAERSFEIFQIITGSVSEDGNIGDAVWGYSGLYDETAVVKGSKIPDAVLTELRGLKGDTDVSEADKARKIAAYVNFDKPLTKGTDYTETSANGSWTFSGLTPGYYLVRDGEGEDETGSQNIQDGYYTLYCAEVTTGVLVVTPKGTIPTIDKLVNGRTSTSASIGETVNYTITATVPASIEYYNSYYLEFSDTMYKGLTYKADSMHVYIDSISDDNEITKYFYKDIQEEEGKDTAITVAISDLLKLTNIAGKEYKIVGAQTKIIVSYDATLNKDALITNQVNPNEVKLYYSNDPNTSGDAKSTDAPEENPSKPSRPTHVGDTVTVKVDTLTTKLTVNKVDQANAALAGAEFTLEGKNGTTVKLVLVSGNVYEKADDGEYYQLTDGTFTKDAPAEDGSDTNDYKSTEQRYTKTYKTNVLQGENQDVEKAVAEVDENGVLTFTGLGAGTYTLKETKTPAGYNTAEDLVFTIEYDNATKTFKTTNSNIAVASDGTLSVSIKNVKGSVLPTTGGMGTTIFYVVGTILVLGAVVVLITKKRMSAEKN
jgi:fimbrial isopeptide formation D2 family protein/LPXTG-motif cell wall-anchored protein